MATDPNITTIRHYGHYSVTGPVVLPLALPNGASAEFVHEGFRFPGGRYSALYKGNIQSADNLLTRVTSNANGHFILIVNCVIADGKMRKQRGWLMKKGRD